MLRERLHGPAIRAIAGRRRNPLARAAAWASVAYLSCWRNYSYDPEVNGEARVLSRLAGFVPREVLDVGANEGGWARRALAALPAARVHSFEIVPDTAEVLARTLEGEERATINAVGLGAAAATVEVKYFPGFSEGSGQVGAYDDRFAFELRSCPVVAGDDYCAERGIERVDLLKIDVEGSELDVLAGFERMLGAGAIDVVQFEYGPANVVSRTYLRDFHELFDGYGYAVGKIYPRSVEFGPYAFEDEDFRGPNYLAVRAQRDDLVEALRG